MYVAPAAGPGGYKDSYIPGPTWTGFYLGLNGGWAGSESASSVKTTVNDNDDGGSILGSATGTYKIDGGFFGGQIGYNLQSGPFVYGIEGDIEDSSIHGSSGASTFPGDAGAVAAVQDKLDWFGSVRGRIGYSFGPALLYGTGGVAFGGVKETISLAVSDEGTSQFSSAKSQTLTGYTVGAGVEYMFYPSVSLKVEYQFMDLGTAHGGFAANGPDGVPATVATTAEYSVNTIRAGINYHIGSVYEPLK